jgi:hypothetical protein
MTLKVCKKAKVRVEIIEGRSQYFNLPKKEREEMIDFVEKYRICPLCGEDTDYGNPFSIMFFSGSPIYTCRKCKWEIRTSPFRWW